MPRLTELVDGLDSVRLGEPESIPATVEGVAIVGSTCSGKSTLVDAVRDSELVLEGLVAVPKRLVTRPQRTNDNTVENEFVTVEEMERYQAAGKLAFSWVRHMENGRKERYAFLKPSPDSFPVYSGNNALYEHPEDVQPLDALEEVLLAGIYAPDAMRAERLQERSPDLFKEKPEEVTYRLGDSSENILPHVGVVVENYGEHAGRSAQDFITLLTRLID